MNCKNCLHCHSIKNTMEYYCDIDNHIIINSDVCLITFIDGVYKQITQYDICSNERSKI